MKNQAQQSEVYIFAGGGTGGHLYPGLAVANQLRQLRPGAKIVFACSNRAIDHKILDPLDYVIVPQPVQPIPSSPRQILPFLTSWHASRKLSRDLVADLKPAAVLGLGGFAAGPMVKQAAASGIRSGLLNPDAVPGKANKFLARFADAIFTQFEETADCFAAAVRTKIHCIGCPIRDGLLGAERAKAAQKFQLRPERKTLLVLGGSLGAKSVNEAVAALLPQLASLAQSWQVLHVTGPTQGEQNTLLSPPPPLLVRQMEYCHEMDLAFALSDFAICRGGASTIAELACCGLPSIILPYPWHKDQQQKLNAAALERAGAAIVCEDTKDGKANAARLAPLLLSVLSDQAKLEQMKAQASSTGKPSAARDVAVWLAQQNKL